MDRLELTSPLGGCPNEDLCVKSRAAATLLCCIVSLTSACHRAARPDLGAAEPEHVERRAVGEVVRPLIDEIPRRDLPQVAARIARLRLEPEALMLRIGDTVSVRDSVRVLAIDSAGISIGRLPVYDSYLLPGAAVLVGPQRVAGREAGVSELQISFPRVLWGTREAPRPTVTLRIEVRD